MAHLEVLDGRFRGRRILLRESDLLIGREKGKNHLVLPDEAVSRQHVRVRIEGDKVTIEDCGTSNGTFVNGSRISSVTELTAGDRFEIGSTRFRLDLGDVKPAPDPPAASPREEPKKEGNELPSPSRAPAPGKRTERMNALLAKIETEAPPERHWGRFLREDLAQRDLLSRGLLTLLVTLGTLVLAAIVYRLSLLVIGE